MTATAMDRDSERAERTDYVAEHLLSRCALLVRLLVRQVGSHEISRTEGEVLSILSEGPRRITELAELEGVAQPTMTLLVKRLENNDWVTREGMAHDGRVVMVSITNAGSAALEEFRSHFLTELRADLEGLSQRQLAALSRATVDLGSFVERLQRGVER
jgi:DNA-binding MarR family transcriptional regulator